MLHSIDAVEAIELPHHPDENGDLVVMGGLADVPFAIARIFVVRAPKGAIRGQHAHIACTQFLNCAYGTVEVLCDDGRNVATIILDRPQQGLLIPPGIWAQQTFGMTNTVLAVLCDRPFEPHDYIRNYADFRAHRIAGIKP